MDPIEVRFSKFILLLGLGVLIFLAPIKFGLPLSPVTVGTPHSILEWLVFSWPHGIWHIGIVILGILWLATGLTVGRIRLRYSSLDIFIWMFLATAIVPTINAVHIHRAQSCLIQWFCYAITYFLVLYILDNEKDIKYFLGILIIPAVLISLYSIYQYHIGLPETRQWAGQYLSPQSLEFIKERLGLNRAFGTFVYPNTLAGYILLIMPLAIAMLGIGFREHIQWWKGIVVVCFFLVLVGCIFLGHPELIVLACIATCLYPLGMLYALYITFSKGGYLVLGTTILIIGALMVRKRYILVKIFVGVVILMTIFILLGYGTKFVSLTQGAFFRRWEYWIAGISMIKEHPVMGIGPDNFGILYSLYKIDIAEETQNAHNNFLQIWVEQGIFGLIAFCGIWVVAIKKGLQELRNKRRLIYRLSLLGLFTGIIAFAIHNLGDFDWYIPGLTIIAWVFLALLIWLSGTYREKMIIIKQLWVRGLCLMVVLPLGIWLLLHLERNIVAEYYINEGKKAFKSNNHTLAEGSARTSINLDKDNPDGYYLLGRICEAKGDYLGSISWYRKAIEYNQYSALYYYRIALAYIQWMQTTGDKSVNLELGKALKKAVELYPVNPFYHLHLAQFYESNALYNKALVEYNYCLELNNKIKKEYNTRGKMLKRLILPEEVTAEINHRLSQIKSK